MRRHVVPAAESSTGRAEEQLQVVTDNFFEPCGDARIDSADQAGRANGELLGYTRLGKLKVLGVDVWTSCGLWPSKKATHKGLKKTGAGGSSPGGAAADLGGFGGAAPAENAYLLRAMMCHPNPSICPCVWMDS